MTVKRDPEEQFEELQAADEDDISDLVMPEEQESSTRSWAARAAAVANDLQQQPLTDTEALELGKLYALLAIHHTLEDIRNG